MAKNKVSVLVTFYNQEDYVDTALQSILDQKTSFGVKIIVGDDGSSDKTIEKVEKWISKYPDVIEIHIMERTPGKHISGFRASRNRLNLLKYVDTDYFIYLDGDDFFNYEEKLQKQVEVLDNQDNEDCIACGHDIDMLYSDGRRASVSDPGLREGKITPKEYWDKLYFHTDTLLVRSSVIPTINEKLLENNFNDNMITYSFIQKGNLYYIPKSWAVYLQTGDGIWTSGKMVINHIRNMFLIDLCNIINPDMKRETDHRFAQAWLAILKIRKQIDPSDLVEFSDEAIDKELKYSYKWIHYPESGFFEKLLLCLKAISKCWKLIIRDLLAKPYHALLKRG